MNTATLKATRQPRREIALLLFWRPWPGVAALSVSRMDLPVFRETRESLYDLLDAIRKRLGMWVAEPELIRLYHFVRGYGSALCSEQLTWKQAQPDFRRFEEWVAERLNFPEATPGWYNMIREHCGNERAAFDKFYELLDEFRAQVHSGG